MVQPLCVLQNSTRQVHEMQVRTLPVLEDKYKERHMDTYKGKIKTHWIPDENFICKGVPRKVLFADNILELHKDGTYEIVEHHTVDEKDTYEKRQDEWVRENNLKVGDKVRVIGEADSYQDNWCDVWVDEMHSYVGNVCTVVRVDGEHGIILKHTCVARYSFPYFVLDKVEKERTPWTDAQMTEVAMRAVLGKRQTLQWDKGSFIIVGLNDSAGIVGVVRVDDKVKLITSNRAMFCAEELMNYNINGNPCYNEEYI